MKELSKTPAVRHEVVGEAEHSQRIDNFLRRRCKGVPKSHLYRILRSGEVRVNGGRVGPDYRLQSGDQVRIPPLRTAAAPAVPAVVGQPFEVLFEDDALIVLNKPAGVAVHGGSGVSFGVIEQIRTQRPESGFIELAHRLDRDTSGLLLLAKKRSALTTLHAMMRDGAVRKRYLALVKGRWRDAVRNVRLALHKYVDDAGERRVTVSDSGRMAHSLVRLKARWQSASLVEVELITGRTHQIRVHLAHLGHPICGDDKYGDFAFNRELVRSGLKRMFLHAANLELAHPADGRPLELAAPLPADLRQHLDLLDRTETRDHGTL
jgi:23S rRNA pseudouridine955/2504/2580 synthase